MTQKTTEVGRFNAFKAARLEAKESRSKRDMSGVNSFWEWTKVHSPKLYRQHLKEDAQSAAFDAYMDITIDDPANIDLWDELSALFDKAKQKRLTSELAVLGLDAVTTKRDIRNAYRRKARKLHPDVGGDAEAFKHLHAAYRTLLKEACE